MLRPEFKPCWELTTFLRTLSQRGNEIILFTSLHASSVSFLVTSLLPLLEKFSRAPTNNNRIVTKMILFRQWRSQKCELGASPPFLPLPSFFFYSLLFPFVPSLPSLLPFYFFFFPLFPLPLEKGTLNSCYWGLGRSPNNMYF